MENETVYEEMENENISNEEQDNTTIYENNVLLDDEQQNTENQVETDETIEETNDVENEIIEENVVVDNNIQTEKLEQIHQDLGFICSFLILIVLFIVFRCIYKFFDMFFKI